MGKVISPRFLQYQRGEKLFRDGKPCPPKPSDECTGLEPHSILWIGYRVAKAMDFMKRCDVARALNMPEPEWRE
jgi:hypothetical protein